MVVVCVFAVTLEEYDLLKWRSLAVAAMPRIVNQFMNVAYVAGNLTLELAT